MSSLETQQSLFMDKAKLRDLTLALNAEMGFVSVPDMTAKRAREQMVPLEFDLRIILAPAESSPPGASTSTK